MDLESRSILGESNSSAPRPTHDATLLSDATLDFFSNLYPLPPDETPHTIAGAYFYLQSFREEPFEWLEIIHDTYGDNFEQGIENLATAAQRILDVCNPRLRIERLQVYHEQFGELGYFGIQKRDAELQATESEV